LECLCIEVLYYFCGAAALLGSASVDWRKQ